MRKYELMYILRADLDEAGRDAAKKELADLLVANGATLGKVDESFGLRDFVVKVSAEQVALDEFTRKVRHNAKVLRFFIVADQE